MPYDGRAGTISLYVATDPGRYPFTVTAPAAVFPAPTIAQLFAIVSHRCR